MVYCVAQVIDHFVNRVGRIDHERLIDGLAPSLLLLVLLSPAGAIPFGGLDDLQTGLARYGVGGSGNLGGGVGDSTDGTTADDEVVDGLPHIKQISFLPV